LTQLRDEQKRLAKKKATISDVAKEAGVHPSTVSRVLNNDRNGRTSAEVAKRIRQIAWRLDYRANPVAASMRTKSSRTIGFIVHDFNDPVYPPLLKGIESVLRPEGYLVVIGNTNYDIKTEIELVENMALRFVDGLILATTRLIDPVLSRCLELGVPTVSVLRRAIDGAQSAVVNDCLGGMRTLTRKVLEAGHKDISFIAAPLNLSSAIERYEGVIDTLAEVGILLPPDRLIFVEQMGVEQGYAAMQKILSLRKTPPQAVICVNDLVALGALKACKEHRLRCPEKVSITGYNDIPFLDLMEPPLTSVHIKLEEIGAKSGALIMSRIKNPSLPPIVDRVAPYLQIRSSLGTVR